MMVMVGDISCVAPITHAAHGLKVYFFCNMNGKVVELTYGNEDCYSNLLKNRQLFAEAKEAENFHNAFIEMVGKIT